MKWFRLSGILLTAAILSPVSAQAQFSLPQTMPSVARPGPGEPLMECRNKMEYPKSAIRYEQEGVVTLQFLVDKDGAILGGNIVKSSGFFELDKAALVGLAKCAWKLPEDAQAPAHVKVTWVWKLT